MSNLTIENISHAISTGDIDALSGRKISPAESHDTEEKNSFLNVLKQSFEKVNQNQVEADRAIKEMIAGRNKNIHETMLTLERADSSLKLMMQVRNKILDAYKEIMRMQI